MTTKLDGQLRREIDIDGEPYVVTLGVEGLKLAPKGRRKGLELAWSALVSGEAALATALNASLGMAGPPPAAAQAARGATSRARRAAVPHESVRGRPRADGDATSPRAPSTARHRSRRSASKP